MYLPKGKYCVYPQMVQAGHCDAPGIMSAVSSNFFKFRGYNYTLEDADYAYVCSLYLHPITCTNSEHESWVYLFTNNPIHHLSQYFCPPPHPPAPLQHFWPLCKVRSYINTRMHDDTFCILHIFNVISWISPWLIAGLGSIPHGIGNWSN